MQAIIAFSCPDPSALDWNMTITGKSHCLNHQQGRSCNTHAGSHCLVIVWWKFTWLKHDNHWQATPIWLVTSDQLLYELVCCLHRMCKLLHMAIAQWTNWYVMQAFTALCNHKCVHIDHMLHDAMKNQCACTESCRQSLPSSFTEHATTQMQLTDQLLWITMHHAKHN